MIDEEVGNGRRRPFELSRVGTHRTSGGVRQLKPHPSGLSSTAQLFKLQLDGDIAYCRYPEEKCKKKLFTLIRSPFPFSNTQSDISKAHYPQSRTSAAEAQPRRRRGVNVTCEKRAAQARKETERERVIASHAAPAQCGLAEPRQDAFHGLEVST